MVNHVDRLDALFHALSDPSRRAMVHRLVQAPASVSQLAEPLAMSLPAVMQHLAVLASAGIVTSQKVGRVRTIQLVQDAFGDASSWIEQQRPYAERQLDRLEDLLAADPTEQEN